MKKYVLFSLFGGVILFFYQFLSHAAIDLHKDFHRYTDKQDTITSFLQSLNLEEGSYMMPMYPEGFSQDEIQKYMEAKQGKPWIILQYHKNWDMGMIMPMVRGLITDILVAGLLMVIFAGMKDCTTKKAMVVSLMVGLIGFLNINYTTFIWYQTPSLFAWMLDGILPWLALGWLGAKMVKK
jgi:hypothetical protein